MEDNRNAALVGQWVLLHTDVYFDSANNSGVIGKLSSADIEDDRFYVAVNGDSKLFASDYLMVLKDKQEIYDYLRNNLQNIAKQDILDLYEVCLLMDSEKPEHQRQALQTASGNSNIREAMLVTLENQLKRTVNLQENQEENIGKRRGR